MAKKQQIPTELHDYLKYTNTETVPKARQCQTDDVDLQETAADCQGILKIATISNSFIMHLLNGYKTGISTLLNGHPNLPAVVGYTKTSCNMDTETRRSCGSWW